MEGTSSEADSLFWNGKEKRKHKRIDSSAVLTFRPMEPPDYHGKIIYYRPADSLDVSESGLLFNANKPIFPCKDIKIRLRLIDVLAADPNINLDDIADTEDFVAIATVRRVVRDEDGSYQMAAEFKEIISGNLETLRTFINAI